MKLNIGGTDNYHRSTNKLRGEQDDHKTKQKKNKNTRLSHLKTPARQQNKQKAKQESQVESSEACRSVQAASREVHLNTHGEGPDAASGRPSAPPSST